MAYKLAIILPLLQPPIISILIFSSSKAFKAPAWAIPLIPPPERANPIFINNTSYNYIINKHKMFIQIASFCLIFMVNYVRIGKVEKWELFSLLIVTMGYISKRRWK